MLELKSISRTVGGACHIGDVSIALERGSLNVLLGPTLSGKTSLMRLMAGLDAPTSGRVLMDGTDVTGVPVRKRNVAMVYQQFINYPTLSVYENIASPLRLARRGKDEIDRAVREAADLMRLTSYLDRTPLTLSGGQQQRTALARALVKKADLVLLDEPLANLDYKLREELREEMPKIFAESGAIFVYATTEPEEALLLGGSTATLSEGRLTQFGPTIDVYRRPDDLVTARTFSDPPLNVIALDKRGATMRVIDGDATFEASAHHRGVADGHYRGGIRPHHVRLATDGDGFEATVVVAEVTGSQTFVHADMGEARVIALLAGVRRFEAGQTVRLTFEPDRLMLFSHETGARIADEHARAAA